MMIFGAVGGNWFVV